jgi:integrase
LANGLVDPRVNRTRWSVLRERFLGHVAARKSTGTLVEYRRSLNTYERLMRPVWVLDVTTSAVDQFVERRKLDRADISPATINKDLRALKAMVRKANRWDMLDRIPAFEFLREAQHDPDFIAEDQFAKLYEACGTLKRPADKHYEPSEWWQALLAFAFTIGWRIGQILALKRDDLDFSSGTASVRAEDTNGKRDASIELHPWVLDHLKLIVGFEPFVFAWPHHRRTLSADFDRLKDAAGVVMPGQFHRLRYGFATYNAGVLDRDVLQRVMQHASSATTQRYINVVERMRQTKVADRIYVPSILKRVAN